MNAPDGTTQQSHHRHRHQKLRPILKPLLVLCVLAVGIIIIAASPLKDYLRQVSLIREQIDALGAWGPAVYMLAVFALVSMGMPRLLFCPIGGMVFGLWWGLLWTQIPTLIGYYMIFLFVRWGGRDFVLRHFPRLSHAHKVFHRRAIPTIFLMRQLPISGLVINLLLGLSPISHWDFIIGTAIGLLPEAIPMTALGASAIAMTGGRKVAYVAGFMAVLIVIWLVFGLIVRRSKVFTQVKEDFEEEDEEKSGEQPTKDA